MSRARWGALQELLQACALGAAVGKPLLMRDVPHGARVQIRYAARRRVVVITNERNQ